MAELSAAEGRAIEATSVELQRVGFADKFRALQNPTITTYATDGAISFANPMNYAKLTKGSAVAYTLAAPTSAQDHKEE